MSPKPKSPPNVRQRAKELRKDQTKAEAILWEKLRNRKLSGHKFRRQQPIGPFIVDFYCRKSKLVIELDGGIHQAQKGYDTARTQWLEDNSFTVLRFLNQEVEENIEAVFSTILENL